MIINYYAKISKEYKKIIRSEEYYKNKVENGLFYCYDKEFFSVLYLKSKSFYGVRECRFLSYPMLAIHNMLGIYLFKLTEKLRKVIKEKNIIISRYGGKFILEENGNVKYKEKKIKKSTKKLGMKYWPSYKEFSKEILKNIQDENNERKVVIKIDIENFYNNIDFTILLNKIEEYISSKEKNRFNFNNTTKETIVETFKYLMGGKQGLPTIEESPMNSFIGYLYLCFADIGIVDKIKKEYDDLIENIKLIRYVDDIYVFLEFKEERSSEKLEVIKVLNYIKKYLYSEYGLKINAKTKLFDLSEQEQIKALETEIKYTSIAQQNPLNDELSTKEVYEELKRNIKELKDGVTSLNKLKKIVEEFTNKSLNKVFDYKLKKYIKVEERKMEISSLLQDMTLPVISFNSKVFAFLLYGEDEGEKNKDLINRLKAEMFDLEVPGVVEIELMLQFLAQEKYKNPEEYFKKIIKNKQFKEIILEYNREVSVEHRYNDKIEYQDYSFTYQIIQRKKALQNKNYSLALNHLLNEFQLLCFKNDRNYEGDIKNYTLVKLGDYLKKIKNLSHKDWLEVFNLYDDRNTNQISHGSLEDKYIKSISKKNYERYSKRIENIIETITELS